MESDSNTTSSPLTGWSFDPTKHEGFEIPTYEGSQDALEVLASFSFLSCKSLDIPFCLYYDSIPSSKDSFKEVLKSLAIKCPRVSSGSSRRICDTLGVPSTCNATSHEGVMRSLKATRSNSIEERTASPISPISTTSGNTRMLSIKHLRRYEEGFFYDTDSDLLWVCDPKTRTVWVPEATKYTQLNAGHLKGNALLKVLMEANRLPSPQQTRLWKSPNIYAVLPQALGVPTDTTGHIKSLWDPVIKGPKSLKTQILEATEWFYEVVREPDIGGLATSIRNQMEPLVQRVDLSLDAWKALVSYKSPSRDSIESKQEILTAKQKQAADSCRDLLRHAMQYNQTNPLVLFRRLSVWSACLFRLLQSADDFVPAALQSLMAYKDETQKEEDCIQKCLWALDCAQATYIDRNLSTSPPAMLAAWLDVDLKIARIAKVSKNKIPGFVGGWVSDI